MKEINNIAVEDSANANEFVDSMGESALSDYQHNMVEYFAGMLEYEIRLESSSIGESISFCRRMLMRMPNMGMALFTALNYRIDNLLPAIETQEQFTVLLKLDGILEKVAPHYDTSEIIDTLADKMIGALHNMPDDMWRVRVLTQLTDILLKQIFHNLPQEECAIINYMSARIVGGEQVRSISSDYLPTTKLANS